MALLLELGNPTRHWPSRPRRTSCCVSVLPGGSWGYAFCLLQGHFCLAGAGSHEKPDCLGIRCPHAHCWPTGKTRGFTQSHPQHTALPARPQVLRAEGTISVIPDG